MKPDIYQVELIGSGSLSVMAKPVSGEWIEDEFIGIREWGIDTFMQHQLCAPVVGWVWHV